MGVSSGLGDRVLALRLQWCLVDWATMAQHSNNCDNAAHRHCLKPALTQIGLARWLTGCWLTCLKSLLPEENYSLLKNVHKNRITGKQTISRSHSKHNTQREDGASSFLDAHDCHSLLKLMLRPNSCCSWSSVKSSHSWLACSWIASNVESQIIRWWNVQPYVLKIKAAMCGSFMIVIHEIPLWHFF